MDLDSSAPIPLSSKPFFFDTLHNGKHFKYTKRKLKKITGNKNVKKANILKTWLASNASTINDEKNIFKTVLNFQG